jgi:hypothetical protein
MRFIKIDTGTDLASSSCLPSGTRKTSIIDALSSLKNGTQSMQDQPKDTRNARICNYLGLFFGSSLSITATASVAVTLAKPVNRLPNQV